MYDTTRRNKHIESYRLTEKEKIFKGQFKQYLSTVAPEILGPIILNNPGEKWRIMMIKKSGIEIPPAVQKAIEYQEKRDEEIKIYREFLSDQQIDKNSSSNLKGHILSELYNKFIEQYGVGEFSKFKSIIIKIMREKQEIKSADNFTYAIMKFSVLNSMDG